MDFKKLDLAELEQLTDIFGNAQHAFFDPGEESHHVWAKDMAARHIGRGVTFWAGVSDDRPVGLVGLLHDRQPNGKNREFAQITHIGVRQDLRQKGYGSSLLANVESVARSAGVLILEAETNAATAVFYEKNGYTIDAKHRFGEVVHLYKDLRE